MAMKVFCCYAHEDESYRMQLETHLSVLKRQGLISLWYDRQISAGTNWAMAIDTHLEMASIILLLISADFLASDYCYGVEMRRAMARHEANEARVVPIVLRPCDWEHLPLASLQALPRDAKPISRWKESDEAWKLVTADLRRVIEEMQQPSHQQDQRGTFSPKKSSPSTRELQNRERLRKRVRRFWIKGVLGPSLRHAAFIPLKLHEQPDAVTHPWRFVIPEEERSAYLFSSGASITQIYDDANGELLILGEPGAGKTTLLLELTRELLDRAEQDETHPIPVVFHLSSWAVERQALTQWLVKELKTKYDVPPKLAHKWVEEDLFLLLLDGLDEVAEEHRSACITALNTYRQEHGFAPLVITSRRAEYQEQATRLSLYAAVVVQPLTIQQIDDYLAHAGEQLEVVRSALRHDPDLQEMATTPLMLSILAQTSQGISLEDLVAEGFLEARRQRIFERYIAHMLRPRGSGIGCTREQTISWLAWLAQQMLQRSQTIFYIERMQPNWLPRPEARQFYRGMLALVSGLIGGLIGGFFGEGAGNIFGEHLGNLINTQTLIGGLFGGLGGGLFGGYTSERSTEIQPAERVVWEIRRLKEPVEHLVWALMGKRQRSYITVLVALLLFAGVIALLSGLNQLQPGSLFSPLLYFLYSGVLLQIILPGLSNKKIDERDIITPNQGIWHSARHGLLLGLTSGLAFGLYMGIVQRYGFEQGLIGGFMIGLIVGLSRGGYACFQHLVLRLSLWSTGSAPWNYPRFLNSAVERSLLRKVGGGYIFAHWLLLEHFAKLYPSLVSHDEGKSTQDVTPIARPAQLQERLRPNGSSQGGEVSVTRRIIMAGLAGLAVGGVEMLVSWEISPHPRTIYRGHTTRVNAVAWSHDGRYIASASQDGTIQIWNAADGKSASIYPRYSFRGTVVAWSHDGTRIALVDGDKIQIWNVTSGELVFAPSYGNINALAWSPDGTRLASANSDKMVQLWDVIKRKRLSTYYGHSDEVQTVMWSPDGTRIASADLGSIQVWNVMNQKMICAYQRHSAFVTAVAWSPDSTRIASASEDRTIQIWDAANAEHLLTYPGHLHSFGVTVVAWSPDGARIVSGGRFNSLDDPLDPEGYKLVHVWNAIKGNLIFTYQGHSYEVSAVAWSPDGKWVASAGAGPWDVTVQVWSPDSTK